MGVLSRGACFVRNLEYAVTCPHLDAQFISKFCCTSSSVDAADTSNTSAAQGHKSPSPARLFWPAYRYSAWLHCLLSVGIFPSDLYICLPSTTRLGCRKNPLRSPGQKNFTSLLRSLQRGGYTKIVLYNAASIAAAVLSTFNTH